MLTTCWSQSRLQDITDKRNLETHIRNQYSSAMEHLKMEHQEPNSFHRNKHCKENAEGNSKDSGHFQTNKLQNMLSPYNCSNKKFKHYNNSNPNTPHMPDYNQPINNDTVISLLSSTIEHTLKQNTALHKEHYISSAKTYDGKDPKEFNKWLDNVDRISRILNRDHLDIAISNFSGVSYINT